MDPLIAALLLGLGAVLSVWWVRRRRDQHRTQWVSPTWLEEQRREERRLGVAWLPPWNWAYLIEEMKRREGRS